jgi:hypothetical protein
MFGSTMLETAIGMAFVFLTVSLAVTAANELLASLFRWRAGDLEKGIGRLLAKMAEPPKKEAEAQQNAAEIKLLHDFKNHALIQSLVKDDGAFPSYISPRTFATVLLAVAKVPAEADTTADELRDAINSNKTPLPAHLKQALLALLDEAQGEIHEGTNAVAKFREAVEGWFNGAMDRVGGWYKRRSQYISLGVAFGLALAMNLDSIEMTQRLSKDATLRQALAAEATRIAQKPPAPADATKATENKAGDAASETAKAYTDLAKAVNGINELGLPIGWEHDKLEQLGKGAPAAAILLKLLGLCLTALAASLGAPFWFDVLSRFTSIRSTGKAIVTAPAGAKGPKPEDGR